MTDLPMPSDVKKAAEADRAAAAAEQAPDGQAGPVIEPPSAKLLVRLFLIPLLIVAGAVGVMFLIGLLTGGTPSFDDALAGLKEAGGERTGGVLVGPGAKQRYMYAKALTDQMKQKMQAGMKEDERIKLASDLREIVEKARADEGDVKHFLLLALGRVWEVDPRQPAMDSPAAVQSRQAVVGQLLHFAEPSPVNGATEEERHDNAEQQSRVRKAAMLALAYMTGREEVRAAIPRLVQWLDDPKEDLDVRMAAATTLGKIATPRDEEALAALRRARAVSGDENAELVWQASLSLAELNQPEAADTVLMLLNRADLAKLKYLDRETDWKHPVYRTLTEPEQQRFLINTMEGAIHLQVPEVQAKIRDVAEHDPSARVREAGREVLRGK
jgi:hypothetical protein